MQNNPTIAIQLAQEVMQIEANAIQEMSQTLDENFIQTIETILNCSGKVILMGMGKSGHIANKIASTLASTGTPAFFIHPAEAAHGDLGMIMKNDIVLIISNSGESDEILTLVPALRRKGVQIISITGRAKSTIAVISDIHILAKINQEACPLGLAPTTSTTLMLALGDAIAVCLLDARGFTVNDFALSHPAGSLGKSLLICVADLMHQGDELPVVTANSSLQDVIITMTEKALGLAVIIDENNKLQGVFTDGDLRRVLQKRQDINQLLIKEVMSTQPKTISAKMLASEALHLMQQNKITSLMITDESNQLLGVIRMSNLLKLGIV